jgi:hypothetical protein
LLAEQLCSKFVVVVVVSVVVVFFVLVIITLIKARAGGCSMART